MLRELGEAALQQNLQEFLFLRSGFRSFCTHTYISVRCIMEAWRRRILSEPRLFFLLWVIFRIRVQRVLLGEQADVVFALFCKIDL